MKSFYKVCIKLAIGIILLGIILLIISISSGASWRSLNLGPIQLNQGKDFENKDNSELNNNNESIEDEVFNEDETFNEDEAFNEDETFNEDEAFNEDETFNEDEAFNEDETFNEDEELKDNTNFNNENNKPDLIETYRNVKSINIDIHYGSVIIKNGNKFKIEAFDVQDNELKSYIDGDTWKIKDSGANVVDLFGFRINDSSFGFQKNQKSEIVIYIPEKFKADDFNISLGAGTIEIDSVSGNNINFDVGAGKLQARELYSSKKANFTVGAGEIRIDYASVYDTDIEAGVGSVKLDGVIKGDSSIDCGIGSVNLNLEGNEDYYNYYIDSGIGNVIINEDKYSFTDSTKKLSDNAKGEFDIQCGIGNVTIKVN